MVGARGFEPPTPRSRTEPISPEVRCKHAPLWFKPNDTLTVSHPSKDDPSTRGSPGRRRWSRSPTGFRSDIETAVGLAGKTLADKVVEQQLGGMHVYPPEPTRLVKRQPQPWHFAVFTSNARASNS